MQNDNCIFLFSLPEGISMKSDKDNERLSHQDGNNKHCTLRSTTGWWRLSFVSDANNDCSSCASSMYLARKKCCYDLIICTRTTTTMFGQHKSELFAYFVCLKKW